VPGASGHGRGDAYAIVCAGQQQATTAASTEPDIYQEVWRNGRIFVGSRIDLATVTQERMREVIERAWRNRAAQRLVAGYDSRAASRRSKPSCRGLTE